MAQISADKVVVLYDRDFAPRHTVYALRNFNSGDYLDVSSRFAIVDVGMFIVTGSTVVTAIAQTTSVSTGLTLTLAGSTAVSGILVLRGPASTGIVQT